MKQRFISALPLPAENQPGKHGFVLLAGASVNLALDIKPRPWPTRRSLHFVAEHDIYGKVLNGDGLYLRKKYDRIDDSLETIPGSPEAYSLHLSGKQEAWPREAYIRVDPDSLSRRDSLRFCCHVRGQRLRIGKGSELVVELGIYRKKRGRHATDATTAPDEVVILRIPPGTYPWRLLSRSVRLPNDAVMLLVRISGTGFSGDAWISSPRLFCPGGETVIPLLVPHQPPVWPFQTNWVGHNLSQTEWPRLAMSMDGHEFLHERIYLPGNHWHDFDVPLPSLATGRHRLTVKLDRDCADRLPIKIRSVELLEESARPVELIWHPEYAMENKPFPILIERNTARDAELQVFHIDAGAARANPHYTLRIDDRDESIRPRRVVRSPEKSVHVGAGDIYCMPQQKADFQKYLVWYLENHLGNAIAFRTMYYVTGTRRCNPEAWRALVSLVNQLGLPYHHIEDGRHLSDQTINPSEELLRGPFYEGRQHHEADGLVYAGGYEVKDTLTFDLKMRFRGSNYCFSVRHGDTLWIEDINAALDVRAAEQCCLNGFKFRKPNVTRHTGPSTLSRYMLRAGYEWVGTEQMYGPEEITLASVRGATRAYGKPSFGAHLAHQWGSGAYENPRHAHRLFLSLATAYLQGADDISTEDGLWRIMSWWEGHDRFSHACRIHQQVQRDFLAFVHTHPRRGVMRVPIAVIQGRHCGWQCKQRTQVWGSRRPEFAFGPAEESFDLLKAYYPRTVVDYLVEYPIPVKDKPNGCYSGTPYGPVDLLPVEAPSPVLRQYDAVVFLGWNTYQANDLGKMIRFVKGGGTLILAKPHLSTNLQRGEPGKFPRSELLDQALGADWRDERGRRETELGRGRIIYYGQGCYPSDSAIRKSYERDMCRAGEAVLSRERDRGWISGTDDVNFAVYDRDEKRIRTIYLLNIDWWSGRTSAVATLLFGKAEIPLQVRKGRIEVLTLGADLAVLPDAADADVLDIAEDARGATITVQSDRGTVLHVARRTSTGFATIRITQGGVQQVHVPALSSPSKTIG